MNCRLPRVLGVFPDAIVIVDAQGQILQANAQALSLFGFADGQLHGMSLQALFPGQRVPPFEPSPRRRSHSDRQVEIVGVRGGSRRFRAALTVMPIEGDNSASAVISIRDVTEAQQTQFVLERGLELLSTVISTR
jgi:two-component system, sensor histidine kinase and response regulator